MEPKPLQKSVSIQANLNTILLFLVCTGVCWLVKMVNDLQVSSAVYSDKLAAQSAQIQELTRTSNDKSNVIQSMDIRLSKLETTMYDHSNQSPKTK